MVHSFKVTKETLIEGNPDIGKTAAVEYTSTVIRKSDGANKRKKTAIKIIVMP